MTFLTGMETMCGSIDQRLENGFMTFLTGMETVFARL